MAKFPPVQLNVNQGRIKFKLSLRGVLESGITPNSTMKWNLIMMGSVSSKIPGPSRYTNVIDQPRYTLHAKGSK